MDLRASLQDPPRICTTGSYSIDGGQPVQFTIPGSATLPFGPGENVTGYGWYNQRLFRTESLGGDKEHEIVISYDGNSSEGPPQPLLVDYFLVENNRPQDESTGGDGESGGKISVGGIAGGVVGSIFALITIAVLVSFLRRQKKQREMSNQEGTYEPFDAMAVVRSRPMAFAQAQQSQDGTEDTYSTFSEAPSGNFVRVKQAQRVAVDTATRQELDIGLWYGNMGMTSSSRTANLSSGYTSE
ncbi:hypothetical protein PQX77_016432 [Marasmius sp. AFHP31]|nr:hypothetical protein PQX77_016432 [Marasmius sp. AFHP31]